MPNKNKEICKREKEKKKVNNDNKQITKKDEKKASGYQKLRKIKERK